MTPLELSHFEITTISLEVIVSQGYSHGTFVSFGEVAAGVLKRRMLHVGLK